MHQAVSHKIIISPNGKFTFNEFYFKIAKHILIQNVHFMNILNKTVILIDHCNCNLTGTQRVTICLLNMEKFVANQEKDS